MGQAEFPSRYEIVQSAGCSHNDVNLMIRRHKKGEYRTGRGTRQREIAVSSKEFQLYLTVNFIKGLFGDSICHIPPVQVHSAALWQPHHQSPAAPCNNKLTNVLHCIYNIYNSTPTPSAGVKQELQVTVSGFITCIFCTSHSFTSFLPTSVDTSSVQSYLSFGFSTYFLNCLTTLRVCSANSLDGSMIRALGPLVDVFT